MVIVKKSRAIKKKTISFSELAKAFRVTLCRKWNTPAGFRNIPKSVGNFVMTVEQEQVVYGPECGNRCSAPPKKYKPPYFRHPAKYRIRLSESPSSPPRISERSLFSYLQSSKNGVTPFFKAAVSKRILSLPPWFSTGSSSRLLPSSPSA
uniref:Uncharacterized protein n=1 Tax=uncultured prokaryote TaxID=198431 RepID=A0A0H5Q9C9_9ZZZZ|nr:hypothetical protein [uncultured prokaryote]